MIERLDVVAGPGTVIRYGGIVAWADHRASPALISFLAQSARNLSSSIRGGRQVADHIATVLADRDPEPHVGFAVIGPSDHGWATLLHGPVQLWDGARWLAPTPAPGWLQAIVTPQPALTVGSAGAPTPTLEPDTLWDLEAGVVPAAGFVLVPTPHREPTGVFPAPPHQDRTEDTAPGDVEGAGAGEVTTALAAGSEFTAKDDQADSTEAETVIDRTAAVDIGPPTEMLPGAANAGDPGAGPGPTPAAAGSVVDLRNVPAPTGPPLPARDAGDPLIPGAPVVAGVRCPSGHLNRPSTSTCARCGAALASPVSETVSGSRPALGSLVTDDGVVYRLDRGYLAGSDPTRTPTVSGGIARPLVLTGVNVAAEHAEIRLNDWDVAVIDRGSTGGTYVFEPDAAGWDRLKPFEPRRLVPGAHIAFGQRVVTYASPWLLPG